MRRGQRGFLPAGFCDLAFAGIDVKGYLKDLFLSGSFFNKGVYKVIGYLKHCLIRFNDAQKNRLIMMQTLKLGSEMVHVLLYLLYIIHYEVNGDSSIRPCAAE